MKCGVVEGCFSIHIQSIDVGAGINEQLHKRGLIRMRGGMERSCAPVLVVVDCFYICAGLEQKDDRFMVPLPACTMQRR